jgi:hypothetical protein
MQVEILGCLHEGRPWADCIRFVLGAHLGPRLCVSGEPLAARDEAGAEGDRSGPPQRLFTQFAIPGRQAVEYRPIAGGMVAGVSGQSWERQRSRQCPQNESDATESQARRWLAMSESQRHLEQNHQSTVPNARLDGSCQSTDWYSKGQSRVFEINGVRVVVRLVDRKGRRVRISIERHS